MVLAFCTPVSAEPEGKEVVNRAHQATDVTVPQRKVIYLVHSAASAIPIPVTRLDGIPTTTSPIIIIGDPRKGR